MPFSPRRMWLFSGRLLLCGVCVTVAVADAASQHSACRMGTLARLHCHPGDEVAPGPTGTSDRTSFLICMANYEETGRSAHPTDNILPRLLRHTGRCSFRHEALAWVDTKPERTKSAVESEATAELDKERLAAERFQTVLEKNPRRGTALDKVYGFHVERGSLEGWVRQYRDRVQLQPEDGAAWMLLGLIEMQRGQDASAVQAFQNAEKFLPDNALASYYLGQSLVLVGQSDQAAAALERALKRKPAQVDQLEIFQALGRIHQRAHQTEEALAVWKRLEELFPNDWRVQEQIAQTLVEEGQPALALPRFEALAAKSTKDLYRQSQFRIQAAELKVQLNRTKVALADFEALLGGLNPDNWLYRDVRQKIEAVYLRNEDYAGLATYYEGWLKKHPEDVDAMARVARILAGQQRTAESQAWLEKGLKLAPTRQELRKVIIDQLVYDQKYAEAIQQYEILNQQSPHNPDTIREWGRLILKDTTKPISERQQAATALWKQLLVAKPKDPVVVTQVADLFRQSDLTAEALKLYRQAIELAPEAPQYREYLGEYYHQLKQPAEALKTWQEIASGKKRTAENLSRLGEVLNTFGYLQEGTAALQEAVQKEPQEFDLRLRLVKVLQRGEKYAEVLEHLAAAEKLATTPEQAETVLQQQLLAYQAEKTLTARIESLTQELTAAPPTAQPAGSPRPQLAQRWYLLTRYCEEDGKRAAALHAAQKALECDPQSIRNLSALARLQEATQNLSAAAESNRKLAALDRRLRSEYLTKVARLEGQLGHVDLALKAGREALAATPGNPDSYDFYAQLCFDLGSPEEGLDTLRRAVRLNPSDTKVLLTLADKLAEQFKTPEALEFYWRAFDKSPEIDGKLEIITKLTELYLASNHFDKLLERLERQRRADPQQMRGATLCLAQAHQTAGDSTSARKELERLLTTDTRDTALLQQLAKLSAAEGDFFAAVKYQRQLIQIAPNKDATAQLATYLTQSGDTTAANELLVQSLLEEKDPETLLKSVDGMLARGQNSQVLLVTKRVLAEQPQNWEFLYREGIALATDKPADAEQRFRQLLALKVPESEPGSLERGKRKGTSVRPWALGVQTSNPFTNPFHDRQSIISTVRDLTLAEEQIQPGMTHTVMLGGQLRQIRRAMRAGSSKPSWVVVNTSAWVPHTYGQARTAAWGWMLKITRAQGTTGELLRLQRLAWDQNQTSEPAGWDWYTVKSLLMEGSTWKDLNEQLAIVRSIIHQVPQPSLEAQVAYLSLIGNRPAPVGNPDVVAAAQNQLSESELDEILTLYHSVRSNPEYQPVHESFYGAILVNSVQRQLRFAKRDADADKIYQDYVDGATSTQQILNLSQVGVLPRNLKEAWKLWDRADQLAAAAAPPVRDIPDIYAAFLTRSMAARAEEKQMEDVLTIVDRYLTAAQRQQRVLAASGNAPTRASVAAHAATHLITTNATVTNGVRRQQMKVYYQLTANKRTTHEMFDFPAANPHYHYESIQVLRNAFAIYKEYGQVKNLIQHFEARAQAHEVSAADRLPWRLGLVYLQSWSESPAVALRLMTEICEAAPEDQDLRLQLAEMLSEQSNWGLVMKQVDLITDPDPQLVRKRELLALRAAMRLADTARARTAALYLATSKLDAATQDELTADMTTLGLHQQANKLSSHGAPRAAANTVSNLVTRMQQHEHNSQTDTAAEVAFTILRRTQSVGQTLGANAIRTASDIPALEARVQALQFLVKSSRLAELIQRTESQLESQPKSLPLNQILLEYYTAAGQNEKKAAVLERLALWDAGDGPTRWDLGLQQLRSGNSQQAIKLFQAAIRLQSDLLQKRFPQLEQELQNNQPDTFYVSLLAGVDLRQMGSSPHVINIINKLVAKPENRASGVALFKRAWGAFPRERLQMLTQYMINLDIANSPDFYDYAREALIPIPGIPPINAWAGFDIRTHQPDGRVTGLSIGLLDAAKLQQKLADLEQKVAKAAEETPAWTAGPALLGIIRLRLGETAAGVKSLQTIAEQPEWSIPAPAAWLIAQELKSVPEGEALAIRFYEMAISNVPFGHPDRRSYETFALSPESPLVDLYAKTGQKEKARHILLKRLPDLDDLNRATSRSDSIQDESLCLIADKLVEIGAPMDALRAYRNLVTAKEGTKLASNVIGGRLASKRIDAASKAIEPAGFIADLEAQVQVALKKAADSFVPAIDLLLCFTSDAENTGRAFQHPQITSLLSGVLERLGQQQESHDAIAASLKKLQQGRPDDVSILIARCMLDLKAPQPDAFGKSAEQLEQWIKAHPAAALTDNSPEFARVDKLQQRALRLTYWLVARECLQREGLQSIGERLYRHSLAVASLSPGNSFQYDICREAGTIAFDSGDKAAAEARWSDEIDLILARTNPLPRAGAEATEKRELQPLTAAESLCLWGLADRAVSKEMPGLSFKAARAAIRTNYRIMREVTQESVSIGPRNVNVPQGANTPGAGTITWVLKLTRRWQTAKFPPPEIYQTLLEAVLPSERPEQILFLARPLPTTEGGVLESLSALLVQQAVQVNQVDDLRARIKARSQQPGCELTSQLLVAMLDIAARDKNSALESLHALCQASGKDPSEQTTELLCHVVLPALDYDDVALAIEPLLPRVFTHINIKAGGLNHERVGGLLARMAQNQFRLGNVIDGKRLLDQFQNSQEVRYGSEVESSYNVFIRKRALFRTAEEFAKAGQLEEALDRLAKSADMPAYEQFKDSSDARNGMAVYKLLMATKPEERYRLLSAWTLAVAGKNTIRVMDNFGPDDASPALLAEKFMQLFRIHPLRQSQVLMQIAPLEIVNRARSAKVLVQAALEADKLQDLEAEVRILADQKVERAQELLLLIRLARAH